MLSKNPTIKEIGLLLVKKVDVFLIWLEFLHRYLTDQPYLFVVVPHFSSTIHLPAVSQSWPSQVLKLYGKQGLLQEIHLTDASVGQECDCLLAGNDGLQ